MSSLWLFDIPVHGAVDGSRASLAFGSERRQPEGVSLQGVKVPFEREVPVRSGNSLIRFRLYIVKTNIELCYKEVQTH